MIEDIDGEVIILPQEDASLQEAPSFHQEQVRHYALSLLDSSMRKRDTAYRIFYWSACSLLLLALLILSFVLSPWFLLLAACLLPSAIAGHFLLWSLIDQRRGNTLLQKLAHTR